MGAVEHNVPPSGIKALHIPCEGVRRAPRYLSPLLWYNTLVPQRERGSWMVLRGLVWCCIVREPPGIAVRSWCSGDSNLTTCAGEKRLFLSENNQLVSRICSWEHVSDV